MPLQALAPKLKIMLRISGTSSFNAMYTPMPSEIPLQHCSTRLPQSVFPKGQCDVCLGLAPMTTRPPLRWMEPPVQDLPEDTSANQSLWVQILNDLSTAPRGYIDSPCWRDAICLMTRLRKYSAPSVGLRTYPLGPYSSCDRQIWSRLRHMVSDGEPTSGLTRTVRF